MVTKTFSGKLFFSVEESIYALEEIPDHKDISKNFDRQIEAKPKKYYIPSPKHPWRRLTFLDFVKKHNRISS